MHSFLSRANALFAFTLSVLAGMTFCCFLTNFSKPFKANVVIKSSGHMVKHVPDYTAAREKSDLAHLHFDIHADLSPLFDWNTKQLFLYLTAEYKTVENELNQVVLWDKIVLRGENAVIDMKRVNPEYFFWDDGSGLKSHQNVTLTLSWNVIPNAGALPRIVGTGAHSFSFPGESHQNVTLTLSWNVIPNAGALPRIVDTGAHSFSFPGESHQNVTLTLSWNVIPNAGALPRIVGTGAHSFSFPGEYASSRTMAR